MDTSAARAAIFKRIRQAQGGPEQVSDAERQQVAQYLAESNPGPKPAIGSDLVGRFCKQAERTSQTLDRVGPISQVPAAV
ncbi:MAG: lactate utilization protein C, partial [Betaproteobacteria bacterium]